jgi:HSP20 family protein
MADIKVNREEGRRPEEERRISRRGEHSPFSFWRPGEFFSASPFALMRRLMHEMDRPFWGLEPREMEGWAPAVEVTEKGDNLVVSADLPGLTKDEVKVDITNEGLVIQGERKREHEEKHEGYYRSERSYGRFYRVIPLPEDASLDKARARFNNGVLEVTIPVPASQRKRREIPIEGGEEPKRMKAG